jgi:hypothetical protein
VEGQKVMVFSVILSEAKDLINPRAGLPPVAGQKMRFFAPTASGLRMTGKCPVSTLL